MKDQVISVTEFKAKCLGLIDRVQQEGGTVTITKRGKPVATLGAARTAKVASSEGRWARMFPDLPVMELSDFDMPWDPDPERFYR